jgi:acetoin utilization deacetylase AcuC-like enzyme
MFFYSENYNYPLHKWDGQPKITINPYRYQVVFEHIKAILGISINDFLMDTNIDFNEILLKMGSIHSKEYLDALQEDAYYYAYCFGEFELSKTPIGLLRKTFLYPQLAHALGTYEATRYAIDKGFAVSLGGGHHHALRDLGEGFSLINDIAFAAQKLGDKKILIVDADAHRGNGVVQIVGQLKNIFIYDLYNCENYPTGDEYK